MILEFFLSMFLVLSLFYEGIVEMMTPRRHPAKSYHKFIISMISHFC